MVRAPPKSKGKVSSQKSVAASKTGSKTAPKPPVVNGHGEPSETEPIAGPSTSSHPDTGPAKKSNKLTKSAKEQETKSAAKNPNEPSTSQERENVVEPVPPTADSNVLDQPKSKGRQLKGAKTNTKTEKVKTVKPVEEPTTSKSRKRKIAEEPEPVPSTSGVVKKTPASNTKTKSKKLKVDLALQGVRSISGRVFVLGENDVGQLGFGEEVEVKKRPTLLDLPFPIVDVVAGGMHSVCLTENGEVITFGCNDEGALGRVTTVEGSEFTPHKVQLPEKIVQVSAGDSHTAALAETGQVYLWGNFRCGDGHLGLTPDGAKQIKPVKILQDIKVVKIASGSDHLVCLSKEGNVYTCGCGDTGQLGRISERYCRDGGRKGVALLLEPTTINSVRTTFGYADVWAGAYSTFLKAQDTNLVYAFGLNNYCQLGFEHENSKFFPKQVTSFNDKIWKQIWGGQHHTLALDDKGQVHALGRSDYGRLGLGEDSGERQTPTALPVLSNEKCTEISCGNCVSFSLSDQGSVYSWGFGTNHQLGHGNDDDCHVPTRIESEFFNSWKAHKVSGGGQHTLILATPRAK